MRNALSVDVEDWFQVGAFERTIDRADWDSLSHRVERNTDAVLDLFGQAFPERTFDVGIAEQHAVTFCAGLAADGMKPVCAIYSTFLQRGYDQVVHDVAIQSLPVRFAMDRAGLVGADGATHQGLWDIAYFRNLPNTLVMAPKDENELQHMLKTAIDHPGPAAVRYPRGNGEGVPMDPSHCCCLPESARPGSGRGSTLGAYPRSGEREPGSLWRTNSTRKRRRRRTPARPTPRPPARRRSRAPAARRQRSGRAGRRRRAASHSARRNAQLR
mgnify:CR=1 FL=1